MRCLLHGILLAPERLLRWLLWGRNEAAKVYPADIRDSMLGRANGRQFAGALAGGNSRGRRSAPMAT